MEIIRAVARPHTPGPVDWFTAEVEVLDTVAFAPGEQRRHGDAPGERMSHVAIAQPDDRGEPTYWQPHVTDAESGA